MTRQVDVDARQSDLVPPPVTTAVRVRVTRTVTRWRIMLAVLAVTAAMPAVAAAHPYTVDLQQVSGPSPFAAGCPGTAFDSTMITGQEVEPSITVNPANPRNLVGTWKQDVGPDSTRADLVASSLDGGRTWRRSTIPGLSKCTGGTADGGSDPWVSAGVDGTAYFSGLAPHFQGDTALNAVVVSRSRDGGRTWRVPATISPPDHEGNEMPAITASRRRPGRAYVVWADFATAGIKFSTTNDRGASWSAPVVVDPSIPDALDLVPRLVVLPSGALVTVFARAEFAIGLGKIYATRSLDGGASWTAPVEIAAAPLAGFSDPETGRGASAAAVRKRRGRVRRIRVCHRRGQHLAERRHDQRVAVAGRRSQLDPRHLAGRRRLRVRAGDRRRPTRHGRDHLV